MTLRVLRSMYESSRGILHAAVAEPDFSLERGSVFKSKQRGDTWEYVGMMFIKYEYPREEPRTRAIKMRPLDVIRDLDPGEELELVTVSDG